MSEPKEVNIGGKQLTCLIYGYTQFIEKEIKLNSRWLTFFDWEAFARNGRVYLCGRCGFAHEFYK